MQQIRQSAKNRLAFAPLGRDRTVDILRGLAIAMVVFGHVVQRNSSEFLSSPLLQLTTTIQMPLFAFLSGYVLFGRIPEDRAQWVWGRALRLLVPFWTWPIIYYGLRSLPFQGMTPYVDFSGGLLVYLERILLHPEMGLWYLSALFGMCVMIAVTFPLQRRSSLLFVIAAMAIPFGMIAVLRPLGLAAKFGIPLLVEYYPFFIGGFFIAKHGMKLKFARVLPALPLLFVGALIPWVVSVPIHLHSGLANTLATLGVRWVDGTAGIAFAVLVVQLLLELGSLAWLYELGINSLGIYASSDIFLRLTIGHGIVKVAVAFAATMSLSLLATVTIRRVPVLRELLLGEWRRKPTEALGALLPTAPLVPDAVAVHTPDTSVERSR